MRFLVNNQEVNLDQVDPNESILSLLRTKMGLFGTKEGCASGDCGACTVVLMTEDSQGQPQYQAINACIALTAQLEGKHLITVEGLQRDAQLHPVQQALVDLHGSQCGFCTPGIVMSLYALYQHNPQPDRSAILDALSGNLCRCTGYRPIVDAALSWSSQPKPAVQTWQPAPKAPVTSDPGDSSDCFLPHSETELADILQQHPHARLLAGGTDLALEVTQQFKSISPLVALAGIDSLKAIEIASDHLRIGALTSYQQLEPVLAQHYPEFGAMLHRLGSRQIRNLGTLGGNVVNASPIGDTPPVLLALAATLELASAQGARNLPIEDFFVAYRKTALTPGEYLRAIRIPRLQTGEQLKVYKISKRFEDDISAVLGAFYLKLDGHLIQDARLAFGGMAAIPKRARQAEQALIGQPFTETSFRAAAATLAAEFTPLSDVRASADYRLQVAHNLLLKCWLECSDPASSTRVFHPAPLSSTTTAERPHA